MNTDSVNTVEATAERVLPIGTVVTVSSNRDLLMIVARGVVARTADGEGWCDYAAVLYPQGLITDKALCFFNRENVREVVHMGYVDEVERQFAAHYEEQIKNVTTSRLVVKDGE